MPGQRSQVRLIGVVRIQITNDARNPFVVIHASILQHEITTATRFLL
jgi:hypothetical protein